MSLVPGTSEINNARETIPTASGALAGTIEIFGAATPSGFEVEGTGTTFTDDFQRGDFLYLPATAPFFAEVEVVVDDTHMILKTNYTAVIASGTAYQKVLKSPFTMISLKIAASTAVINGTTFAVGDVITLTTDRDRGSGTYRKGPIDVDATGGSVVTVLTVA